MELSDPLPLREPKRRVTYIYDGDVGNYSYGYGHPMKPHRMRMTHNLVTNYNLLPHMDVIRPRRATREQMTRFHSGEYVDFLNRVTPETVQELTGDGKRFLIGEDCPAFSGLWEFCTISAGGSLSAATVLNQGSTDIAVNWAGGLHHAKKREASGFCYVNDIVLCILELLRVHLRVLYIDIDIHHGDGVEEAFYTTDRVMTVSFHKFGDFFPGTGDVRDTGIKKGKGYCVNVPLRDGVDEQQFGGIFRPVLQHIMDWYRPGAVVLQCGADSLAGDKLGCFNLSMRGHADCVSFMKSFGVPLVCVGGGGYTVRNVAKTWTYETGLLLGRELAEDLPFNDYFNYFGPEYKLDVPANSMENRNSKEYLEGLMAYIVDNLRNLSCAPSVQMQETPGRSINPADVELSDDEDSDLDERISKRLRDSHIERYGDELSGDEMEDEEDTASEMGSDVNGPTRGGRRGSAHSMARAASNRSAATAARKGAATHDLERRFGAKGAGNVTRPGGRLAQRASIVPPGSLINGAAAAAILGYGGSSSLSAHAKAVNAAHGIAGAGRGGGGAVVRSKRNGPISNLTKDGSRPKRNFFTARANAPVWPEEILGTRLNGNGRRGAGAEDVSAAAAAAAAAVAVVAEGRFGNRNGNGNGNGNADADDGMSDTTTNVQSPAPNGH